MCTYVYIYIYLDTYTISIVRLLRPHVFYDPHMLPIPSHRSSPADAAWRRRRCVRPGSWNDLESRRVDDEKFDLCDLMRIWLDWHIVIPMGLCKKKWRLWWDVTNIANRPLEMGFAWGGEGSSTLFVDLVGQTSYGRQEWRTDLWFPTDLGIIAVPFLHVDDSCLLVEQHIYLQDFIIATSADIHSPIALPTSATTNEIRQTKHLEITVSGIHLQDNFSYEHAIHIFSHSIWEIFWHLF